MKTHAERFRHLLQVWELTQEELGNLCGIKRGTVGTIVNGKTTPDGDALSTLLRNKPDLNPDWLLTGSGPMLRDGRALTPLPKPEAAPVEVPARQPRHDVEQLPMATGGAFDAALLQEVKDSRDRAWEQAALLRAELDKAWAQVHRNQERADHFQDLYLKKVSDYLYYDYPRDDHDQEESADSPAPTAPVGKTGVDSSSAAGINPNSGFAYFGMPDRYTNGNVIPASAKKQSAEIMSTDNVRLLATGELLHGAQAVGLDGYSAIDDYEDVRIPA